MTKNDPLALYKQYYVERDFDRLDLFEQLAMQHDIKRVLYPGSYVHITPSFVYPTAVYVDNDKKAKKFFADTTFLDFIAEHKQYAEDATVTFYGQSYTEDFGEEHESFDLLISQYAGFISLHCKAYLKIGGILLVNNSHGDASMASLDDQFELDAIVLRRNGKHRLQRNNLEDYLTPKTDQLITRQYLEEIQRGIGYKKSASMYIFKRVA